MKTNPDNEHSPNHTWSPDEKHRIKWRKDKQRCAMAQANAVADMRRKP